MAIFESLFDITYLCVVTALGFRLLPEKNREARLFGIMAIVLGLGDSFHLLPRVISHLSPGGFAGHAIALSWGQFIASITMTLFYVLFYHYYRSRSGDGSRQKALLVYFLAGLRIALVLLPQNQWGQMPGSYLFGIYRNIPFAILGGLLIFWSYQKKHTPGLKHMALLIFFSFAFYVPVVLWSASVPAIGALMMPKTIAYLLIVILGYRYFISQFKSSNILGIAYMSLIMGLIGGVFFRELTRFYQYDGATHLGKLHGHTLVLGFLLLLLLYLLTKGYDLSVLARLKNPLYLYVTGLAFTLVAMAVFGIYEVVGKGAPTIRIAALSGASGLGHILLAAGLIWLITKIYQAEAHQQKS